MNRFFSKLDLRDIKIDPRTTRFLPDAEDEATDEQARAAVHNGPTATSNGQPDEADGLGDELVQADAPVASADERPRYVPSWAPAPAQAAAEPLTTEPERPEPERPVAVEDPLAVTDDVA